MKRKLGSALIVVGFLLVAVSMSFLVYNNYADKRAHREADRALFEIVDLVGDGDENAVNINDGDEIDPTMKTKKIDGYDYIGYLSIPDLGLKLPVMAELDQHRLTISPCRYKGSTKTDNLIIGAHNYRSHFAYLRNLEIGAKITFTDMEKKKHVYKVAEFEELLPTDVEKMESSGYDLTLFTCTYGGRYRVTVRCVKVK